MSNVLIALQILNGLLAAMGNAAVTIERLRTLIEKAQSEGRDISDQELDDLRAESQALTDKVVDSLS